MTEEQLDLQRRLAIADELRRLGITGILVTAAERGKLTEVRCQMPKCYCPDELGGDTFFEPTHMVDWMPTLDHIMFKSTGGHRTLENSRLAHRLCNRIDFAIKSGRPHQKDLDRIEEARRRALEERGKGSND